ncbi:hypothetical protein L6164_023943 [Bauhinia variegata]|uniref:Uncharacterized protein n=1 Tax=Bauhinia variegata TaxID=167791 RepID=A0ACB9LVP0_BAUVA|nr:hypothetical protein L6164_023943 [Bauhinia variegata]
MEGELEEVNYMGQENPLFQEQPQQAPKLNLEEAMAKLAASQADLTEKTNQFMSNTTASIKQLENQVGQISQLLTTRQPGSLPSTIEVNPREHVHAIFLRNGKVVETNIKETSTAEGEKEERPKPIQEEASTVSKASEPKRVDKPKSKLFPENPPPYVPKVPFPQRLMMKKKKEEGEFLRFLEIFKKLQINIPFLEVITKMPTYVTFIKELLSKKRKLEGDENISLNEECSATFQKKLPIKMKNLGKFSVPYSIGNMDVGRALCDLGASVNLMPLSMFKKLGIGEVKL